jgi:hypothetical protein
VPSRSSSDPRGPASASPPGEPPAPSAGGPLRLTALLLALQGLVVVGFGGYLMIDGLVGHPSSVGRAEIGGVLVVALGLTVVAVAWGVRRAARWSRSPAVLVQVLCLPVAWGLVQGERYEIGVPVGVFALVLLALLLGPAGRELSRAERG